MPSDRAPAFKSVALQPILLNTLILLPHSQSLLPCQALPITIANVSATPQAVLPDGALMVEVVLQDGPVAHGHLTITSMPAGVTCDVANIYAGAFKVNTTCRVDTTAIAGNYTLKVRVQTVVGQSAESAGRVQVLQVGRQPASCCCCLNVNCRVTCELLVDVP